MRGSNGGRAWNWWYLLLVLQFVPALWVPLYNSAEPTFIGMPFFYWFPLLWIILTAILTAVLYFLGA